MARYLLDTSTLIDFTNGIEPIASRVAAMLRGDDVVLVCAVTIGELSVGFTADDSARWTPVVSDF